MSHRSLIVCARIADLAEPYAPAARAICAWCDAGIWLGHAVRADVPFGVAICQPCAYRLMDTEDTVVITPSVRIEMADLLRRRGRV